MKVELVYFEECPNWKTADQRLQMLASRQGFELDHRIVSMPEDAAATGFHRSPTILIDGKDPFAGE